MFLTHVHDGFTCSKELLTEMLLQLGAARPMLKWSGDYSLPRLRVRDTAGDIFVFSPFSSWAICCADFPSCRRECLNGTNRDRNLFAWYPLRLMQTFMHDIACVFGFSEL